MKTRIAILFFFFLATFQLLAQDRFIGNWESKDKSSVVQIYEQELQYYAKVIISKNAQEIGKVVLIQMEKKSDSRLFGGTYHDGSNSEYEARLKLLNANTIRIKVLAGIFPKTILWHRVRLIWQENIQLYTVLQQY